MRSWTRSPLAWHARERPANRGRAAARVALLLFVGGKGGKSGKSGGGAATVRNRCYLPPCVPPRLLSRQALLLTGTAGQAGSGVQEEEEMTVALRSCGLRPFRSAYPLARFRSAVKLIKYLR